MGLFFRKRIKINNGLSLNLSKKGLGVSFGVPGCRMSIGADDKKSLNISKNGVYYRKSLNSKKEEAVNSTYYTPQNTNNEEIDMPAAQFWGLLFLFMLCIIFIISCFVGMFI